MTKAQIIQRLLEEKHITVEEAMTLMAQEPTPMMPTVPVWPNTPQMPYQPPYRVGDWTVDPSRGPWYTSNTGTDRTFTMPHLHTEQK